MTADRAVRWTAVAAVLAVAAVAAVISYRHAVTVVTAHGEPGVTGRLYPVIIDGLIVAASMVLLDSARHRERPPALAWWMLAAGVAATLAANVLAGVAAGPLGAVAAAWPALAFAGCYELLMMLTRASARRAAAAASGSAPLPDTATARTPARTRGRAPDSRAAAVSALAAEPGMTARQLAAAAGVSDRTARRHLAAAANGHGRGT